MRQTELHLTDEDRLVVEVLGIGRTALWRTRSAYLQGGVELAVFDVARSGRPAQYDTDVEARVTANHRVEVHETGRRSNARTSLRSETCVLIY